MELQPTFDFSNDHISPRRLVDMGEGRSCKLQVATPHSSFALYKILSH